MDLYEVCTALKSITYFYEGFYVGASFGPRWRAPDCLSPAEAGSRVSSPEWVHARPGLVRSPWSRGPSGRSFQPINLPRVLPKGTSFGFRPLCGPRPSTLTLDVVRSPRLRGSAGTLRQPVPRLPSRASLSDLCSVSTQEVRGWVSLSHFQSKVFEVIKIFLDFSWNFYRF